MTEVKSQDESPQARADDASKKSQGGNDAAGAPAEAKVRRVVPQHYPIDVEALEEMIERRNMDTFRGKFEGLDGIALILGTNTKTGIETSTVIKRQEQFGINELNKKEPVTFLEFLIEALSDRIVQILLGAAVISIIFGMTLPNPHTGIVEYDHGWIEGTAILISVVVVVMTGAINNYTKAKKFEEMEQEQSVKDVSVYRDGKEQKITSDQLVVGDILILETGMEICCDGVYVSGNDMKTNESAITGEPDLIEKSAEKDVFLISGTCVEEGDGVVIVVAVGMDSFQGKMKASIDEESGDTPLQEHLEILAGLIGKFGLAGAVILFVSLSIKEVILITTQNKVASAISFLNFVLIAITLIAVAIPEGLPLAVTIALSFGMHAMMEQNCMVRVLSSCETMGAATAICSDKTGTLTTNNMTVVQGCVCEEEFVIAGYGIRPRGTRVPSGSMRKDTSVPGATSEAGASSPGADSAPKFDTDIQVTMAKREAVELKSRGDNIEKVAFALSINSTAREQMSDGEMKWVGNKTEFGLLKWVKQLGKSYESHRTSVDRSMVKQLPFSSAKKRMTTFVKDNAGIITAYSKGASEAILASCDRFLDKEGAVAPISDVKRQEFEDIILDMANQGNRTIGVAFGNLDSSEFPEEEPENLQLIFLGVLGIQDPIREEVPDAVEACQRANLVVRMVTGDNINTAMAIGKKCGIFADNEYDHAMTGPEFRAMFRDDRDKLVALLPRLRVLARSSPKDKYILVDMLKESGEVVGVTGDGSNDAPALKLAHVGFAMKTGTDIAKGAADMVLIDDNFATVVVAITWGRAVNDNVRKFLQFQLTINLAGVFLTLIGSLASPTSKEPFTPVQLLWLNLIMDTLAAIALATELPSSENLTRKPVFLQARIISNKMLSFILIHGLWQFTLIMVLLWEGHLWFQTIDGAGACIPDFPTVTTNGTTAPHPQTTACKKLCEFNGGLPVGKYCQQGLVHSTMIFNTFIFSQIINVMNARKLYAEINCFEGVISRSKNLLLVFGVILAFQIIAVEVFGPFMSTTNLRWDYWLICIGLALLELPIGFIVRLIPVKDQIPDFVKDKEAREAMMREEAERAKEAKKLRRDPSLRRASFINKRKMSGH